jgi:hypothetical protein
MGETTELGGNAAQDHHPVVDGEASTVRRKTGYKMHTNALWQRYWQAPQPINDPTLQSWRTAPEQTTGHR